MGQITRRQNADLLVLFRMAVLLLSLPTNELVIRLSGELELLLIYIVTQYIFIQ
ncbi:hypothetical protein BDV24DRAFT_130414 [Aspergillus arachidicola]|uniref:Uncharacterized protein n=1 Tax=Aspergillus arachidicola TaxID=656916 RepID=A0A5N6YAI6_9EURO|nr:hypothetical protein BDV24DRAFT_130414 [Aspergillus arachidicola]